MWIVDPEDVSVLDPTSTRALTLVTCYPFYYVGSAPRRFIVRAVLAGDKRGVLPLGGRVPASSAEAGSWSRSSGFRMSRKCSHTAQKWRGYMSRSMTASGAGRGGRLLDSRRGAGADDHKSSETKSFEVLAVDGNQLDVKLPEGTRELTVPDDFRFTVNGQQLSVHQLKPGMKGTATITTRTTVTPVTVTEVKNGTVVVRSSAGIIVRTDEGVKSFTPERRGQARSEDRSRR